MKKVEEKALILSSFTSVLLSLTVVIGVVYYTVSKIKRNRDYKEKWKDYDECGV